MANSYYNNSQYEKAVTWFNKLISAYSEEISPETFYKASISFKSLGAYEISNELLERYLELTNNIVIKNYYNKNKDYLSLIKEEGLDFEITLSNINSENSDFGPSFFGEKQLIYSSSMDGKGDEDFQWSGEPFLDLFLADIDSLGNLQNPIKLEGNINTRFHESSASSTRNKNKIYFTRNNFIEGKIGRDAQNRINLKIYSAESNDGKTWNNIKELPFNDDSYSCAHPTLNSQENRLYFTSNMPGSFGLSDIWYVEILDDDKFGPPINLGPLVNTEFRESFPFIGKNDVLYFSSDGRIGLGGLDVYYTNLDKNGFPINTKNIGEPINSRLDDFGLIYNENTNLGYFSSNRKGIWGSKSDEIYKINKKECNPIIEGIVIDEFTNKPVGNAIVKLSDSEGNMISETIVGDDAKFVFSTEILCGKSYSIEVSKFPGYSKEKITVLIPNYSSQVNEEVKLNWSSNCIPSDLICLLDINPILFDLNKYYINSKAAKELKKIYAAMIKYPNLKINISSHTDSRGTTSYNKKLSENRAISTKNWLVKRGIDQDRLFINSFGEVDLENYCEDNVDCREEEHMINRRSVFTIK